jgi:hypothetical protein
MQHFCGRVAQLGEHLLCKQGVTGSIPVTSTILQLGKHGEEILLRCAPGILKAPTHTYVHTPDEEVLMQVFQSLWRVVG